MFEFDRSILDNEYDLGTFEVDEEALIAYAKALGETNPIFVDKEAARQSKYGGIIGSPTSYAVLRAKHGWNDVDVGPRAFGVLAGESCEWFLPMKHGDKLSAKMRYVDVYEKTGRSGKLVFIVQETTYTNQHGQVVVKVRNSMVRR
jgi:acyl dehydratase